MGPTLQKVYGQHDDFVNAASIDSPLALELAERLRVLHHSDLERAHRAVYLDRLNVAAGRHVLEVGCGTGWVLKEVARRVGQKGRALGVDASAELLALAEAQAVQEGIAIELRQGDARALPVEDSEFDVALVPLVLLHVADAERAVAETIRVVRPGGQVGILERDNESLVVAHPDRALTRLIVQTGTDQTAANAWVGRRLPGMLTRAGLIDVQIEPVVSLERRSTGSVTPLLMRWAQVATDVGVITAAEQGRWQDQLYQLEVQGEFLVGVTHYFIWGTVP